MSSVGKIKESTNIPKPAPRKSQSVRLKSERPEVDTSDKKLKYIELLELFQTTLDPKGSGVVKGGDLKHILACLGQTLSSSELGVIDNFKQGDGAVRYEDFLKSIIFK